MRRFRLVGARAEALLDLIHGSAVRAALLIDAQDPERRAKNPRSYCSSRAREQPILERRSRPAANRRRLRDKDVTGAADDVIE